MEIDPMNPGPARLTAALTRGTLTVDVTHATVSADDLFGFAERRNPKRAFLFVSRVLGKHIPVRPSGMQTTYERLAGLIPPGLPGPVLFVGMAETAVGLGAGVHRAYSVSRSDTMYIASTRYPLGTEVLARFEEEHSHATSHLVHLPVDPSLEQSMLNCRSLVLVDDEASTGKTLVNAWRALVAAGLTGIERVISCVLTDWSEGAVSKAVGESAAQVSLASGRYRFEEEPSGPFPDMPKVAPHAARDWPISPARDWGRLGTRGVRDTLALELAVVPGQRILVIGTGEFVWKPFLLAERLEHAGADVHFGSTTRSPVAVGHAIKHALTFPDNYGEGIPNFLYNVGPGEYDHVLICSETPLEAVPASLVSALRAEVIVDAP